jgi:hypothetical protein
VLLVSLSHRTDRTTWCIPPKLIRLLTFTAGRHRSRPSAALTVVDVRANEGQFALLATGLFPGAQADFLFMNARDDRMNQMTRDTGPMIDNAKVAELGVCCDPVGSRAARYRPSIALGFVAD